MGWDMGLCKHVAVCEGSGNMSMERRGVIEGDMGFR